MVKLYEGLPEFVLETTHGYYSEYGWGMASTFNDEKEAKDSCVFWLEKGGEYRVVSGGEVIYPKPITGSHSHTAQSVSAVRWLEIEGG